MIRCPHGCCCSCAISADSVAVSGFCNKGSTRTQRAFRGTRGSTAPPGFCRIVDLHASKGFSDMSSVAVLLVEDNEDNRTIYTTILRHCGHEVAEAATGEEAIACAFQEALEIEPLKLTVQMPPASGAVPVLVEA